MSTLLTQPPDVVRVRQQIEGGRAVDIIKVRRERERRERERESKEIE